MKTLYTFNATDQQMHFLLMMASSGPQPLHRAPCGRDGTKQLQEAGFIDVVDDHDRRLDLTDLGRRFVAIT